MKIKKYIIMIYLKISDLRSRAFQRLGGGECLAKEGNRISVTTINSEI